MQSWLGEHTVSFTESGPAENVGNAEPVSRRDILRCSAVGALSGTFLSQLGSNPSWAKDTRPVWGQARHTAHPRWRFAFVNHAISNPFFVPTQNGITDACEVLGCESMWLGSHDSNLPEMLSAFNAAVAAKVDGIALSLIHETAFDRPVEEALRAGIPVFAYNADVSYSGLNRRLAYIGQDLYAAGYMLGYRLANSMSAGAIAAFMATRDTLNLQPRANGLKDAIRDSRKDLTVLPWFVSGTELNQQTETIRGAFLSAENIRALVGLDGGNTQSVAEVMAEYNLNVEQKGVHGAGFDLLPRTLELLQKGYLDFTIDQQPYLQGFLTTVEMFVFLISGGMVGPADVNTGQSIVTAENVRDYLTRQVRYEGDFPAGWNTERIGPIRVLKESNNGRARCSLGQERELTPAPGVE